MSSLWKHDKKVRFQFKKNGRFLRDFFDSRLAGELHHLNVDLAVRQDRDRDFVKNAVHKVGDADPNGPQPAIVWWTQMS